MATIKVIQDAPEDLNKDGKITLGERVTAACIMWLVVFIGLNIIYWSIVALLEVENPLGAWGRWLAVFALLDTIATISIAVWRLVWIERDYKHERIEQERRWKREDWEFDQMRGTATAPDTGKRSEAWKYDYYAMMYLKRYFRGIDITRAQWEKDGLPVEWWNNVNAKLQERQIRRGKNKALEYETYGEAWEAWLEANMKAHTLERRGNDFVPK